jgi:hypothetical protein
MQLGKAFYDGMDLGIMIEAKVGYKGPNPHAMNNARAKVPNQALMAEYCDMNFLLIVSTPEGAAHLSKEFPSVNVQHVPFGGD